MAGYTDGGSGSHANDAQTPPLHQGGEDDVRSSPLKRQRSPEANSYSEGEPSSKQPKIDAELQMDLFGGSDIESAASDFSFDNDEDIARNAVASPVRTGEAVPKAGEGRTEHRPEAGGDGQQEGGERPEVDNNAVPEAADGEDEEGGVNLAELFGSDEEEVSGPEDVNEPPSLEVRQSVTEFQLADLGAPNLDDNKLHFMKLPKFISVESKGFDAEIYEPQPAAELEEQRRVDKLLLEHTIRYRVQGGQRAESNARFVRWSDGSLSLLLGSEMFDIIQEDYKSQKQYLAVDHATEHVLQVQAKFTDSLKFAPHPVSGTYTALCAAVEDSKKRRGGIKLIQTLVDPELEKLQAQQREAERLKARRRLEGARRRTTSRYSRDGGAFNERALEAESDEDDAGRTSRRTRGSEALDGYHEDDGFVVEDDAEDENFEGDEDYREDEEDDEEERTRRIMRAKRGEGRSGRRGRVAVDSDEDEN